MIMATTGGVLAASVVIMAVIGFLCAKRRKAKEKLMIAKQNMKEISSAKEMVLEKGWAENFEIKFKYYLFI